MIYFVYFISDSVAEWSDAVMKHTHICTLESLNHLTEFRGIIQRVNEHYRENMLIVAMN